VGDLGVGGKEALVVGARERNVEVRRSREIALELVWGSILLFSGHGLIDGKTTGGYMKDIDCRVTAEERKKEDGSFIPADFSMPR
jgi:hypothetical protein